MATVWDEQSVSMYAAAFVIGVGLHQLVFRFGEWDNWSFRILQGIGIAQIAFTLILCQYDEQTLSSASGHAAVLIGTTSLGIWSSMLIYRAFFHRLGPFHGPPLARLSTFYMTAVNARERRNYRAMQRLHAKYGDYVRVAPRELSVTDPKAFQAIYSATQPLDKGPWYDFGHPLASVHTERDARVHHERRKAWDKAFSFQSMRKYEERVSEHTATLIAKIDDAARSGTPFNVAKWFHFYGWDVMGHVGFGRSFEMLRDGIKHHFYTLVEENVVLIALFSRLIWLFPIFKSIPVVNYKYKRGRAWIEGFARARVEDPPDGQDVFASILGDYNDNPRKTRQDWFNILGDCSTLIVAGSDTTAAALACLFFQFALYPDAYKKLQAEVDDLLFSCLDTSAEGAILDAHALGKLPYLQACIDEALRLYHPIPSGMQRQTGPQGLQIGRTHIPRDTIVQMPLHLLHRDARCFVRPDAFVPERWTGRRDELVRDASVFAPFGVGRFGCVGKQLGLMEMRRVAALVAREYDVRLADGVRAQEIEAGIEDYFTMSVPELNLLFTPRK